jgi:oligoribonuclease
MEMAILMASKGACMDRFTSNLVWIDLEMTGLDPEKDTILEISSVVTTNALDIVAQGPSIAIHQSDEVLSQMDEWNTTHHTRSGLVDAVKKSTISLEAAQEATLAFLEIFAQKRLSPLCGNSVWQDKNFLRVHMPRVDGFLNYRIIDVSSIKEAIRRWYPENPHTLFAKTENHRAQEDILQSIEELKHYKTFFFSPPQ